MPPVPLRAQRSFAANAHSVAEARRFARARLEEWGAGELMDSASLIVSELLTNAVVHAGTPARLGLRLQGRDLRVEVEDHHPGRAVPLVNERPSDELEGGRGLLITTSLSSAWGVEYTATSKRVWALCGADQDGAERPVPEVGLLAADGVGVRVAVVELSGGGVVERWNDDAVRLFGWSPREVVGRPWADLVDAAPGGTPAEPPDPARQTSWQGDYTVACRDGSTAEVFASHLRHGEDLAILLVPVDQRGLLQRAAPVPRPARASEDASLGLRPDALLRLAADDYLALAVEHVRDPVSADATYLLLAHDFTDELEVTAVSGLPESLLGTRLLPGSAGVPDAHRPHLPAVVTDLDEVDVPLLAGSGLRSVLVVPLVIAGRVVGGLGAASARVGAFTDDQAVLLQRYADSIALAADRARLQASERQRRDWLSFIADAGDLLAASLDQDMTMAITGQVVVPRIASWCAIQLLDERGRPVLQQVWHEDEEQVAALRAALTKGARSSGTGDDATVMGSPATSIPLVARGRTIGFLVVGRSRSEMVRSGFFVVAESIARRSARASDTARTHGHHQAGGRALQESLLPASVPSAPGLDVGVVYEAAGESTVAGGDFYDLFPVGNGTWWFVVGDVCGTGAEAAAVTGLARHTIQALARAGFPVAATLERLNTAILDEGERSRFLTLVCGTLRLQGGRVQLSMVNAGHPQPFLVDSRGGVREIGTPQALLGVVDTVAYLPESHVLDRGDLLVALTDGVLERRDGATMLGEEGLETELAAMVDLPAQAVAERIRRLAVDFSDTPQRDDMAILAVRVEMGAPHVGADPDPDHVS